MSRFKTHTKDTAPQGGGEILENVEKAYGFVPNLMAKMVAAPAAANAYTTLGKIFEGTSFSPTERQVVLLTISRANGCEYCVAAHSTIAGMQQVDDAIVEAIRADRPLADAKLEALRQITLKMHEKRGWLDEQDIDAFVAAGYGPQQVLEVVLGVAFKTLSNYTNHVAGTELDEAIADKAWKKASQAAA